VIPKKESGSHAWVLGQIQLCLTVTAERDPLVWRLPGNHRQTGQTGIDCRKPVSHFSRLRSRLNPRMIILIQPGYHRSVPVPRPPTSSSSHPPLFCPASLPSCTVSSYSFFLHRFRRASLSSHPPPPPLPSGGIVAFGKSECSGSSANRPPLRPNAGDLIEGFPGSTDHRVHSWVCEISPSPGMVPNNSPGDSVMPPLPQLFPCFLEKCMTFMIFPHWAIHTQASEGLVGGPRSVRLVRLSGYHQGYDLPGRFVLH